MDDEQPVADNMAAVYFRAEDLARRTVEYHRVREAEHRSRERFGRRFTPFPWAEAAAAVLSDEALEDESSVVALIRELGRQGCSEVALAALDLVAARGAPAASKAMFDAVILVCANEYQDQRCVEQYGRMRSLGLTPDMATANLVLTGLCCRGRLAAAVELLGDMRAQLGLRPNSYSVLMVLQACNYKRRGAYREAIDAVQALEAGGRPANEEVIEALLQVCEAAMHQAPSFEAAVAVFQALSELHLADSTRVYNGLLGAAGRTGRWREAQALYAQMQEDDVPTSLETHTALIQACVVGRALDHALDIFEHLVAGRSAHEAVPASIATYNHLIHACHQAGMLEKALEIAAWVQKTGVAFDNETYGELMATIDVAQLWDDKTMKQARLGHRAVLPRHLRPAPYDAMRVMYLDHLETLQQEELLALEKLGGQGSWAPRSLTRGSVAPSSSGARSGSSTTQPPVASSLSSSARSLARTVPSVAAFSVTGGGGGYGGGSGFASAYASGGYGGLYGGYDALSAPATTAPTSGRDSVASGVSGGLIRASVTSPSMGAAGPGPGPGGPAADRSRGPSRSPSPQPGGGSSGAASGNTQQQLQLQQQQQQQQQRAASVKQMLRSLSTRPLPALGSVSPVLGSASNRAATASASGSPAAPTGFHEPPTWAQLQTLDAATAGPGGTPFTVPGTSIAWPAPDSPGGGAVDPASASSVSGAVALPLAVEPANQFGQPSAASLGTITPRRVSTKGTMGGGGLRVAVGLSPHGTAHGGLPPLGGDPLSPMVVQVGPLSPPPTSPRTVLAAGPGGPLAPTRQRTARGASVGVPPRVPVHAWGAAAEGGLGGGGAGSPGVGGGGSGEPSPLPAISPPGTAQGGLAGAPRRSSMPHLPGSAGKPLAAAAVAGF